MTHTEALLELSPEAYDEIAEKLREAGYPVTSWPGLNKISMDGVAITRGGDEPMTQQEFEKGPPVTVFRPIFEPAAKLRTARERLAASRRANLPRDELEQGGSVGQPGPLAPEDDAVGAELDPD